MPKSVAERTRSKSPGLRFRGVTSSDLFNTANYEARAARHLKNPTAGGIGLREYYPEDNSAYYMTQARKSIPRAIGLPLPPMRNAALAQAYARISAQSSDEAAMKQRILRDDFLSDNQKSILLSTVEHDYHPGMYGIKTLLGILFAALLLLLLIVYAGYTMFSGMFSRLFGQQASAATPAPFGTY